MNLIDWFTDEFRISEADRILLISSLSFDLTQKNVYAPLIRGGTLHLLDPGPYDPYLIIDSIRRNSDHSTELHAKCLLPSHKS